MLPRQYRLRKMKDIDILFKEGRFVGGQYVTLKVWRIDPSLYPRRAYSTDDLRIAFVVGKKVHKRAIHRNAIKRKMREVVRLLVKEERLSHGYHISVIAKPAILDATYQNIPADIEGVLKKARVL